MQIPTLALAALLLAACGASTGVARLDLNDPATERFKAKIKHDCRPAQPWPTPAGARRLTQVQIERAARRDGNQNDTCAASANGFVRHITNRDGKIMKAVKGKL
jgi:hypothetical protein